MSRFTERHFNVAVIKDKNLLPKAMEKLADLEKCRQSDLFNALNIAINCMEKQIPKNPIVKPLGQDIEVECPTCGNVHIFLDTKKGDKYCNHCGQKIDWEEGGTSD